MHDKACWMTALLVVGAGSSGCSCACSLPESKSFCVPHAHALGHPPAEHVVRHQSGETLMSREMQTSAALLASFAALNSDFASAQASLASSTLAAAIGHWLMDG